MLLEKLQREAHIWLTIPDNIKNSGVITQLLSLLSAEEIKKHNRLYFSADRHLYLVSHALVRKVLAKYLEKQPADLKFHYVENGKPEILLSKNDPIIRFNLSHTAGLAACIVTMNDDCGIDAEAIVNKTASLDIAHSMFSDSEFEHLKSLTGRSYLEEFFTRWTLREAYVKALGQGIDYPINQLLFNIKDDSDIDVSFQGKLGDACQFWQFQVMRPTADHIVTTAIKGKNKKQRRIISNWI
jgi:4'-phosphopantetheinyl transferase